MKFQFYQNRLNVKVQMTWQHVQLAHFLMISMIFAKKYCHCTINKHLCGTEQEKTTSVSQLAKPMKMVKSWLIKSGWGHVIHIKSWLYHKNRLLTFRNAPWYIFADKTCYLTDTRQQTYVVRVARTLADRLDGRIEFPSLFTSFSHFFNNF
jgi:hypothetical protein